jgi:hypothetical protein
MPDNSGIEALLLKDDPEFWFETGRLFATADYGGSLLGEVCGLGRSWIGTGDLRNAAPTRRRLT